MMWRNCIYHNLETSQRYLKIPVPHLDYPFKEAIHYLKVVKKKQQETAKILNEETKMLPEKLLKHR